MAVKHTTHTTCIVLTAIILGIAGSSTNVATATSGAASAVTLKSTSTARLTELPCQQSSGMWGDPNPNIFYVCNESTQTALLLQCPEGRGFFNGHGYYGCIPYEEWPACRTPGPHTQHCDSEHLLQPWETLNPNKFYMCAAEALEPLLVSCEQGKGFVQAQRGASQIVGCALWHKWRSYMDCEDYY